MSFEKKLNEKSRECHNQKHYHGTKGNRKKTQSDKNIQKQTNTGPALSSQTEVVIRLNRTEKRENKEILYIKRFVVKTTKKRKIRTTPEPLFRVKRHFAWHNVQTLLFIVQEDNNQTSDQSHTSSGTSQVAIFPAELQVGIKT